MAGHAQYLNGLYGYQLTQFTNPTAASVARSTVDGLAAVPSSTDPGGTLTDLNPGGTAVWQTDFHEPFTLTPGWEATYGR